MQFFTRIRKGIVCCFALVFSFLFNVKAQVSVTATSGTTTGAYVTVNEAFAKINDGTHKGDVVITVTASTQEPATPTPLLKSGGSSSYTSVKIVPLGDVTIASAAAPTANRGIIELAGADNVTIDGDDPLTTGTQNLTIQSATVTTAGIACIRLSSTSTTGADGADNNTVKNCILKGPRSSGSSTTASYGVQFSNGTTASSSSTGAYASINTRVEGNIITNCYYGVYAYGSSTTYYNTGTQILNNTIGSATSAADNVGIYGIYLSYSSAGTTGAAVISGNDVVAGDAATGTSNNMAGIYLSTGANGTLITKNKVHDVGNGSINGWGAYGIAVTAAVTGVSITNNFVWDITGQNYSTSVTTAYQNYGIFISAAATGLVINHNTVYLNKPNLTTYSTTITAPVSACLQITSSTAVISQLYNNIFTNNQSVASTNAYAIITAGTGNITAADNNAYYADNGKIGYYSGVARVSLADWKAATGKDLASVKVLPDFVSPTDLHIINSGTPNQLESAGSNAAGITTDIDGQVRPGPAGSTNGGGTAPDIGADEFDGAPLDLTAPSISYTNIANNVNTTTLVLNAFATITDPGGVNVASGTRPRLYYKHAADANAYNDNTAATPGWKYVEATNTTSPFSFTINYALLPGGAVPGEKIEYFVVAQDNATTPNVGINAGSFPAAPASVALTPVDFPIDGTLKSYYVTKVYAGTVNVGMGEAIESLTNPGGLFESLNNNLLGGNLTVLITTDLTAETGAVILNQLTEQGAGNYTVTIKPALSSHEISGSSATALIRLNGADRIVFDGSVSGGNDKSLTIKNTATTASTNVIWLTSASTTNGATYNTIKNCNIVGTTGTNTTVAGIISGSGVTMGDDAQAPNSNNTIMGNQFTATQNGMYLRGNTTTLDSNWVVKGNTFGSTNPADKLSFRGFLVGNAKNFLIDSNLVEGVMSTTGSTSAMSGIQIALNVANGVVSRNVVRDVKQVNTTGYGAYGINVSAATTTSNIGFYNNFVSDIAGNGSATLANNGHGIYVNAGGGYNFYYNTVSMSTNQTSTSGITSAMLVTVGTGLNIRNNIFVNTQSVGNVYALYSSITTTGNAASYTALDYNAYGSASSNLAYFSGAAKADLAALQAAFAANTHSKQVLPVFVNDITDLHLASSPANLPLEDAATAIAAVTTDIDGEARSATMPDIGADELPPATGLDIKVTDLASPALKTGCYDADSIRVQLTNNSVNMLNFATNPVTVNVNVTGAQTSTLSAIINSGTLASGASMLVTIANPYNMSALGAYSFQVNALLTGDVNTTNNELVVQRTKIALTAGTITASPETYCVNGGTPKLVAVGMDGYSALHWETSTSSTGGFTAISGAETPVYTLVTPITQTMYYRAAFTCGASTVYSDIDSAVIQNPQVVTTTPGQTCGTGTVTLSATANNGATLNWYAGSTGGASLGNGEVFTTPTISSNTTYYVSAMYGLTGNTGRVAPSGTLSGNSAYTAGLIFNATSAFKLNSVDVYLTAAAGTCNIQLQTSTGTVLAQTGSINLPAGNATTPVLYTVPLNFDVPVGTGLVLVRIPGTAYLAGPETSWGAPLDLNVGGTSFGQITSGYWWGVVSDYYFFYNWSIGAGCESPRTPVLATVNNSPSCSTPVTLTSFTGEKEGAVNVLKWTTANELNNTGFELQRSADGVQFSTLGFVKTKADNGNSTTSLSYSFTDAKPLAATNYYRLKQIDKDGKTALSKVVVLKADRVTKLTLVSLYPNPAKANVNINIAAPKANRVTLVVTDLTGRVMLQQPVQVVAGDNLLPLNVQPLAQGTYLLKVVCIDGCETAIKRFVKD